jgi:hypothetical protein
MVSPSPLVKPVKDLEEKCELLKAFTGVVIEA